MLDVVAGLPVHPLVVHATVVVVPTAALAVAGAALWPRFRRWAYAAPLLLALGALVLVPVSTQSGEALEERVGETPLVETHAELGEGLIVWVALLAVVAVAGFAIARRERSGADGGGLPRWAVPVVAVAALLVAGGTVAQTVAIGHSGASAAWSDLDLTTPVDDD